MNITVTLQNLVTMLDGKAIKAIMDDNSPSVCKICIPKTTTRELCQTHTLSDWGHELWAKVWSFVILFSSLFILF